MPAICAFWLVLGLPAAAAGLCLWLRSPRAVLAALVLAAGAQTAAMARLAGGVLAGRAASVRWGWFYVDALSAYHLAVLMAVFGLSTVYAVGYVRHELRAGQLRPRQVRRFGALWLGALAAMTLVLISNNLGALWIGVEATTLITAFLICVHRSAASLEAMWKYLLMCSVGVACAFLGTLLAVASARGLPLTGSDVLLWTQLRASAGALNLPLLKLAFLFLLVGYGTKAGLAPLHSWLPDAHSQAPAPVSALFSGFMLNAALYGILRYVAILEAATDGSGWSLRLLQVFGLLSIVVAAAFVLFQDHLKRLLAYSSIEHLGIVSLGVGLGGAGIFAALFHLFNHAMAKTLAFFAAGRLGQAYGTFSMARIRGSVRAHPTWGIGLLGALLALIGVAPFALFMSEFQVVCAAVQSRAYVALAILLAGLGIMFLGVLRYAIAMAWEEPEPAAPAAAVPPAGAVARTVDILIVAGMLGVLLAAGLWMPTGCGALLGRAAAIVEGRP